MLNAWSDILVTTGDEQKHEKEKRKKKESMEEEAPGERRIPNPQSVQMMVEMDWHSSYIE
jgi:hypothetical protein